MKNCSWSRDNSAALGNDADRNGTLDPDEDDGSGTPNQGWAAYITVFSRKVGMQGDPRININGNNLTSLIDQLSSAVGEDMAAFIIAYRIYGGASSSSGGAGSEKQQQQ